MRVIILPLVASICLFACGNTRPSNYFESTPYQKLREASPGYEVFVRDGWGWEKITKTAKGYILYRENTTQFIYSEDF
jgi:hypothetical protein